jgi:two-component sensor histidine kinase
MGVGWASWLVMAGRRASAAGEGFDNSQSETFLGFFRKLFQSDFMPHGHCYWWKPEIVWLHVISDAVIMLAYYSIPLMLFRFVKKKKDVPFHWVFLMFGAFIFWCGTTHLLSIWTLWHPVYRLDGIVKAITASVSIATAFALFPLIPQALALRSPRELEEANRKLEEENAKRQLAEHSLKGSLREKEALLKEVHHRVKNNLQVTSSLLGLQARTLSDKRSREIFLVSESRIKSMALIHEKLYRSESLSEINIKEYMEDLLPSIVGTFPAADRVAIRIHAEPICLQVDRAIPLGLILNELVSNSMKHGFSSGNSGEISVDLLREGNEIVLKVADSGSGFPKGLDFRNTTSLGLQLVSALAKQLEATIELRAEGRTEFEIRFVE